MRRAGRASRSLGARRKRRLRLCLGLVAGAAAALGATADAAERADCAAVNKGALDVDLAATASAVREVVLKAGERLAFSFQGNGAPTGSLTLVAGAESPRSLLAGPAGSRAAYVATRDGTFAFRFAREGSAAGTFTATCTPAGPRDADASAPKRNAKPSARSWGDLPALPETEMTSVDPGLSPLSAAPQGDAPAGHAATGPVPGGKTAPKPATGLDARLKWEGGNKAATESPALAGDTEAGTTLGVKYKLQPQIMIGVLAQFDQSGDPSVGGPRSPSQQPWMAGPVATVQIAPGLALDARAAWGPGETGAADRVSGISATERRLLDAKLTSTQSFGPWRFSPSVTFNYAEEKPAGTAAASHDALAARTTGAGRIDVTPELAYRIEMPQAMFIEPKAAIGSFWGIDDLSRLAPRGPAHEDMRLKAQAGVTIGSTKGTKLEVGGGVEGGGPAAPDVWSGRLQLSVPLK